MDKLNELNINSLYDFLVYNIDHLGDYKLAIIITNKQTVFGTMKRDHYDHWNLIVDMNKMIYPNRNYDEYNISNDTVLMTSIGNDLEVELPEKISFTQYQEIKNMLRQIKQFEYEYDKFLYMPYNTHEIVAESLEKLVVDVPIDDDEVIIGTDIKKKLKKEML